MKILIGGTELNIKKYFPREHQNGKRWLEITILQSEVEYAALKEILAANTGEIIVTKDDGTTQTLSGYTFAPEITDKVEADGAAVFYIVIQCVAEAERRALEAKAEAAELRKTVAEQAALISAMTAALENLNQQLLVVQLAAAELYEQNLQDEFTEELPEDEDYSCSQYTVDEEIAADQEETETAPELEDEQEVQ